MRRRSGGRSAKPGTFELSGATSITPIFADRAPEVLNAGPSYLRIAPRNGTYVLRANFAAVSPADAGSVSRPVAQQCCEFELRGQSTTSTGGFELSLGAETVSSAAPRDSGRGRLDG